MFPTTTKSWIIYVFLALVLGAIGSGLWEIMFKSLFHKAGRLLLKIFTFGIKSVRDNIYVEIAKKSAYKSNIILVFLLFLVFFSLGSYSFIGYTHRAGFWKPSFSELDSLDKIAEKNPELALKNIKELITKTYAKLYLTLFLFFTVWIILILYIYIKYSYINSAINYFEQCLDICGPYISSDDEKKIISNFSLISCKEDYYILIKQLKNIAEENKITLPDFSIF